MNICSSYLSTKYIYVLISNNMTFDAFNFLIPINTLF